MDKTLIICRHPADLAQKAALKFLEIAREAILKKGLFSVVLSGGKTPATLYQRLAEDIFLNQLDWARVHFFWGDERCEGESNYLLAKEILLDKLNIPQENIHRIPGEKGERAAKDYETELREFFNLTEKSAPAFDLILLGMGDDGHTASIFPGDPVLKETEKMVGAVYVPKLKTTRITLTPWVINQAANIIFLVSGAEKSAVLPLVLEGKFQPEKYPAQIVCLAIGQVFWFVDEAAALCLL